MTKELRVMAECDTPKAVEIPENWRGLLVWALGKWGVGVVFLFLLYVVYDDMREDRIADAKARASTVEALQEVSSTLQRMDTRLEHIERSTP